MLGDCNEKNIYVSNAYGGGVGYRRTDVGFGPYPFVSQFAQKWGNGFFSNGHDVDLRW